jgi:hypothetical protein
MLHFDDYNQVSVTASRSVGPVTVALLDHHRRSIQSVTHTVGKGKTLFRFKPAPQNRPVEALHLHAGAFDAWTETGAAEPPTLDFRSE